MFLETKVRNILSVAGVKINHDFTIDGNTSIEFTHNKAYYQIGLFKDGEHVFYKETGEHIPTGWDLSSIVLLNMLEKEFVKYAIPARRIKFDFICN